MRALADINLAAAEEIIVFPDELGKRDARVAAASRPPIRPSGGLMLPHKLPRSARQFQCISVQEDQW
jgi:hypothetical protein